jgi:hypothetical protein
MITFYMEVSSYFHVLAEGKSPNILRFVGTSHNADRLLLPVVQVQVTLRLTVSQSVCLGVEPRPGLMTRC